MKSVKHKYITTKLFVEDDKCISEGVIVTHKDDNHIHTNYFIICNHYKICPTKNGIDINGKIKFNSNYEDKQKEDRIRDEMNKNKNISSRELHRITGFSTDIVSRYYMKIRRENYGRILL